MKKACGLFLVFAMLLTLVPGECIQTKAASKKSSQTIQLKAGKSKKVTYKKAKKLKWSISKKGKKIVQVKKSGKQGLKITGKKAGNATVKVTYTIGKKVYKNTIKVVVKKASDNNKQTAKPDKTAQPTAEPTVKPTAQPTDEPGNTPGEGTQVPEETAQAPQQTPGMVVSELDLSKFDVQKVEEGLPVYNEATKSLSAKNVAQFIVKLPQQVNSGEAVKAVIKGKNNGTAGFRCWLSNTNFDALSDIMKSADYGIGTGDFEMKVELLSTGAATEILIKGPSYGVFLDDVEITSITVEYTGTSEVKEPKNPYAPETEQAYDTKDLTLTTSFRNRNKVSAETVNSMLVAQRFIADPTTVEYEGRLYVYGTTDEIEFDGSANVISNAYNTHTLSCISTADMVNWKDEGKIDVKELTTFASKSWAPTILSKEINGKTKFFIYFTTGGEGIAVLEADSPTGPWKDPIGKRLIDRSTPTCTEKEVPWLFDPGVFVDDDGSAYIYFGGGGSQAGRICKLGDDMVSLAEEPHVFSPYYYFEDNEINKFGDTYYYSYCTNWSDDLANGKDEFTGQACIAYYTADNPYMENATYHGTVFPNPGNLYDHIYNNHHHMFTFKGESYIAYHTTYLERALYGTKMGYRNLHIDKLDISADGKVYANPTVAGVGGEGNLDALAKNAANIMSDNGGVTTSYSDSTKSMVLSEIHTGDWTKVSGAHFGAGASGIEIEAASENDKGSIEVYIDGKPGEESSKKIAEVSLKKTAGADAYETIQAELSEKITGNHDVYFVYRGSGYHISTWKFS